MPQRESIRPRLQLVLHVVHAERPALDLPPFGQRDQRLVGDQHIRMQPDGVLVQLQGAFLRAGVDTAVVVVNRNRNVGRTADGLLKALGSISSMTLPCGVITGRLFFSVTLTYPVMCAPSARISIFIPVTTFQMGMKRTVPGAIWRLASSLVQPAYRYCTVNLPVNQRRRLQGQVLPAPLR